MQVVSQFKPLQYCTKLRVCVEAVMEGSENSKFEMNWVVLRDGTAHARDVDDDVETQWALRSITECKRMKKVVT